MKGRLPAVALLTVVAMSGERTARADIYDDVYSDIKGVIQDLITQEVSTQVVSGVACSAGHARVPADAKERPDVVGIPYIDPSKPPDNPPAQVFYRLEALHYFPGSLAEVYSQQFGGLKTTLTDEVADFSGYMLYQALRHPGDLGFAGAPVAMARIKDLPTPSGTFTVNTALTEEVVKIAGKRPRSEATAETGTQFAHFGDDDYASCRKGVLDKFKSNVLGGARVTPLEEACQVMNGPSDEIDCDLAFALKDGIESDDKGMETHIEDAISVFVTTLIATNLNVPADKVRAAQEAVLATFHDAAAQKLDLAHTLALLETNLEAALDVQNADLSKVKALVDRLYNDWKVLTNSTGTITLATAVQDLLATDGALTAICTVQADSSKPAGKAFNDFCSHVAAINHVLQAATTNSTVATLWPIIDAASHHDLRSAAHAAINAIFAAIRDRTSCPNAESCNYDLYQRFADSLAMYIIDTAQDNASDATRAAFRSAAEEVIREAFPGGFDKRFPTFEDYVVPRVWDHRFWLHDLTLRASWNSSYVGDTASNYRTVASATFLPGRFTIRYTHNSYAAIHASLGDWLAPLSEYALRSKTAHFTDSEKMLWNFITPRLDFALGFPTLSTHLTVDLGVSFRLAVPVPIDQMGDYKYNVYLGDDNGIAKRVEFGLAVKYML